MKSSVRLTAAVCGVIGAILVTAGPAHANSANYFHSSEAQDALPDILDQQTREYYRAVFDAIESENWQRVEDLLDDRDGGLLHQVALAEYYTHANSPRVSAEQVAAWLDMGVSLPQAEQMVRLGERRGLTQTPRLPLVQPFRRQGWQTKRVLPSPTNDGSMPQEVSNAILERIRNDDPDGARQLLDGVDATLSSQARAEWRQRVAWSYYIENQDSAALAMARTVADGSGPWVAEGNWTVGLAAWRLGDCATAAAGFSQAARLANNVELTAAAHYWAHRALIRCRQPGEAERQLRAAGGHAKTLYGMLALEQLGQEQPAAREVSDLTRDDWRRLERIDNARIAAALVEIGAEDLAGEVIRHQAQIGDASDFEPLTRLARRLGLPQTQLWLARGAPSGARVDGMLQYPVARWAPSDGWKVDPALAFAHALQESNFRTNAVSPANARGLMQITPITVRQHAPRLEMNASYVNLNDPAVNLSFGQRNLEMLRDTPATRNNLPKIMAAYNAGLSPITRWNDEVNDQGDPLLYMESIPYWETRSYVAIVMRNYWMYELQAGVDNSPSRATLAQNGWPEFPEAPRNARIGAR
ncbi:transglycosylase SLT domain-containing protein [Altererythrobacter sp. GH1-8]|uniref:lytic transglycosylase domain-containing protein n=1 Tax=Altererythrobacter sp. GH1-8 TaxID=3349333 RepID=UPI00374D928E